MTALGLGTPSFGSRQEPWRVGAGAGRKRVIPLLALCSACTLLLTLQASSAEWTLEDKLKAAVLYNFAKFVEWPSEDFANDDKAPIVIGILGADPFGPEFDKAMLEKTASGRKVVIKRYNNAKDARACHILFIAPSENHRLPQILAAVKGTNILTVGEAPRFTALGGVIRLYLEEGQVRFEINLDAVKRTKLQVNAELLQLAKIVHDQ